MKDIIIDNVNYGDLVKVGDAYLDRFYAEKLKISFNEAPDAHQIITDVYLDCDLGHGQVHVFLLKKEHFVEQAKSFSQLPAVERVAVQASARNLVVFKDGQQVGKAKTLDHYYTDVPASLLELTDFT